MNDTVDEAKCHITLQAIMGGLYFIGDGIEELPAARLALANNPEMMKLNQQHQHAIPLDLFGGADIPKIWKLEYKDRIVIALFNWLDEEMDSLYELKDLELDSSNYTIKELWTGQSEAFENEQLRFTEDAHSVRVIEFKKR